MTQLPAPVDLAATWDQSLAACYGKVVGTEERGKGVEEALNLLTFSQKSASRPVSKLKVWPWRPEAVQSESDNEASNTSTTENSERLILYLSGGGTEP